ncbi:MAG TPA: thioredoxin domain-containing protein [Chitinophagaceae bacterium]
MKKIFLFVVPFLILQVSCIDKNTENKKVIAKINEDDIYLNDADNYVKYELHDALQRIYVLRKAAAEELIDKKIIELEAKGLQLSVDEFLDKEINTKISDETVNKFINTHHLDSIGMPNMNNGYHVVFPNTIEGKLIAKEEYRKNLRNDLLQSLRAKYKVEVFLTPPIAPKVNIADLSVTHYRGNLGSNIVLLIISDFTCENCRLAYPEFEKIFEKYKEKVKFGFTHFSPNITLAAICSEAANTQGKFWEYQHAVFSTPYLKTDDTVTYIAIAKRLGLDINKFRHDMFNDSIRKEIQYNIGTLKARRIYATPTVLLNGAVILDVFDITKIQKLLDEALEKK